MPPCQTSYPGTLGCLVAWVSFRDIFIYITVSTIFICFTSSYIPLSVHVEQCDKDVPFCSKISLPPSRQTLRSPLTWLYLDDCSLLCSSDGYRMMIVLAWEEPTCSNHWLKDLSKQQSWPLSHATALMAILKFRRPFENDCFWTAVTFSLIYLSAYRLYLMVTVIDRCKREMWSA